MMAYAGRLRSKKVSFSASRYERVEISLAEVIKGVGKSAIWVFNRAQKG